MVERESRMVFDGEAQDAAIGELLTTHVVRVAIPTFMLLISH
jgi:hypothetical protein